MLVSSWIFGSKLPLPSLKIIFLPINSKFTSINNTHPINKDIIIQDLGILYQFCKSIDTGIYKDAVANLPPKPVTSANPI